MTQPKTAPLCTVPWRGVEQRFGAAATAFADARDQCLVAGVGQIDTFRQNGHAQRCAEFGEHAPDRSAIVGRGHYRGRELTGHCELVGIEEPGHVCSLELTRRRP